ncbi:MAG TPA: hypothetical protein PLF59_08180 [Cyclobacteriaceae bacterium]|nr:hypothetical protein [Cyclobacteriaceae bacterium]
MERVQHKTNREVNMSDVLKSSCAYDGKTITDSLGRQITLRKPGILDRFNLMKHLGETAKIDQCVEMMTATLYVAKVDSKVLGKPQNYVDCLDNLQTLGDEGSLAVIIEVSKHVKAQDADEKAKEGIENVKKS